ncbi:MAG TPA: hypothetical protein VKA74_09825 [Myxococcota bacterium]|nr:hypothetical protein [Myxococcota bacterium]
MQMIHHQLERPIARPKGGYLRNRYRIGYNQSLQELERELEHMKAEEVTLHVDLGERDIRLDGHPRSGAKPRTPGVMLTFYSRETKQRHEFVGNKFDDWQGNIRAIGLALQRLRLVNDTVETGGAQYEGFKALPGGNGAAGPSSKRDAADRLLELARMDRGPLSINGVIASAETRRAVYRQAMKFAHPDAGGSDGIVKQVQQAMEALQ